MKNLLVHASESNKIRNFYWGLTIDFLIEIIKEVNLGKGKIRDDILNYVNTHHNTSRKKITDGSELIPDDYASDSIDISTDGMDEGTKKFVEAMFELGYKIDGNEIPRNYVGIDMIKQALSMKKYLAKKLYGQDRAIESVTDGIKNNILSNKTAPHDTYLFIGPPATGKTYLSELMASKLEGYEFLQVDMTHYTSENSSFSLFGLGRAYTDAMPGELTSFVKKNKKAVIVLDEFEKAHYNTQIGFLEIFNSGYKKDACGWIIDPMDDSLLPWTKERDDSGDSDDMVDFTESIFIVTSNLGKELYSDSKFIKLISDNKNLAESMIIDSIKREKRTNTDQLAIPSELVSRLSQSNIVLFDSLTFNSYEYIANNVFREYQDIFSNKFGIKFIISNNFKNFLKLQLLTFSPVLDARRIKGKIAVNFFDKITDHLMDIEESLNLCKTIKISISKEVNKFLKENINDDISNEKLVRNLFRKSLTLELKTKLISKGGIITYKIESCKFTQVKRIKDFDEDGLVFEVPNVSFVDIAGHKKAKERLSEVITFLKDPSIVKKFQTEVPNGILLYGPSGTGKTKLAQALANESDLPFIATTGVKLIDPNIRKKIFDRAKTYAPSIIFIDEIDTLGTRKNGGYLTSINDLLDKIDGFSKDSDENIFIISATNYKERIDPALIRPGRIELHIKIDDLDKEAREYFIKKILDSKPISGKFDIEKLLMYTSGMTGAQLEQLGKESSIYCIRNEIPSINQEILIEQINTIKYGEKLTHLSINQMLKDTAIHEAAHAVISKALMPHIKIEQITVTPRGKALGFVSYNTEESYNNMTKKDFKDRISVAMAGRIAQIKISGEFDGIDTGASNDLEQATKLAYSAIAYYGMDEDVGYINLDGIVNSEKIKTGITNTNHYYEAIDKALQKWLIEAEEATKKIVDIHWDSIKTLSKVLIEKEVVYENELDDIKLKI